MAFLRGTVSAAHHYPQAWLLEDLGVGLAAVAHGPAAQMVLCAPVLWAVDVFLIGVWPLLEPVSLLHILRQLHVVNIPAQYLFFFRITVVKFHDEVGSTQALLKSSEMSWKLAVSEVCPREQLKGLFFKAFPSSVLLRPESLLVVQLLVQVSYKS